MKSFRQEITEQIERIPKGRIFTAKDLTFDVSKTANVNVLLAELVKKNRIKRIEKGTYYIPKESKLGLGPLPLPQNEIVRYLTRKYGGYLSGYCVYNMMGLTEQVPTVLTIATPKPVRPFRFDNLRFDCIKADPAKQPIPESMAESRLQTDAQRPARTHHRCADTVER